MLTLKGTPLAQIGDAIGDCGETALQVPDLCTDCRQVNRWGRRILSFAKQADSRMQAVATAILQAHDDVRSSLCGLCFVNPVQAGVDECECFCGRYQMLGLPMTVKQQSAECYTNARFALDRTCVEYCEVCPPDLSVITTIDTSMDCWTMGCAVCESCVNITFDPCNNADHLTVMQRAVDARMASFNQRPTAPVILAVLDLLFPGGTADIIAVQENTIYVTAGRDLTALERQYLEFLLDQIPVGFQVNLQFLTPC